MNVRVVQELLGHENLNTTQTYLAVTDQAMRDAIQLLGEGKPAPTENLRIRTINAADVRIKGDPRYEYFTMIGSVRVR